MVTEPPGELELHLRRRRRDQLDDTQSNGQLKIAAAAPPLSVWHCGRANDASNTLDQLSRLPERPLLPGQADWAVLVAATQQPGSRLLLSVRRHGH